LVAGNDNNKNNNEQFGSHRMSSSIASNRRCGSVLLGLGCENGICKINPLDMQQRQSSHEVKDSIIISCHSMFIDVVQSMKATVNH